jgi:hypothetical protein
LNTDPVADVVELWSIEAVDGAWFSSRPTATTGLGVPAPEGVTTVSIQGGTYQQPGEGRPLPVVTRTEVHGSTGLWGGIRDVVPDPEGRYLLFVTNGSWELIQLDLVIDAYPTSVIASAAAIPHLDLVDSLFRFLHATEGRKITGESSDDNPDAITRVLLSDPDNDGDFDTIETLSPSQWGARGYLQNVWIKDYLWAH